MRKGLKISILLCAGMALVMLVFGVIIGGIAGRNDLVNPFAFVNIGIAVQAHTLTASNGVAIAKFVATILMVILTPFLTGLTLVFLIASVIQRPSASTAKGDPIILNNKQDQKALKQDLIALKKQIYDLQEYTITLHKQAKINQQQICDLEQQRNLVVKQLAQLQANYRTLSQPQSPNIPPQNISHQKTWNSPLPPVRINNLPPQQMVSHPAPTMRRVYRINDIVNFENEQWMILSAQMGANNQQIVSLGHLQTQQVIQIPVGELNKFN